MHDTVFLNLDHEREEAFVERVRLRRAVKELTAQLEKARRRGFKKTMVDLDVLTSLLNRL